MKIKKRDDSLEEFDINKIITAIDKCFKECGESGISEPIINAVKSDYKNISEDTTVEDVQDYVEKLLMGMNRFDEAKAYILYRDKHRLQRELKANDTYYNTILELVNGKSNDTSKENSNKDASQLYVIRDLIAGETSKKLYKELFLSKKLRTLHDKGIIHIHDCDYRIQQFITNCFSRDTEFITDKGVKSFKDFKEGDSVLVPTHTGEWKKATVHCFGKQQLYKYKISTTNRNNYGVIVRATADHTWINSKGERINNLNIGDVLLTKNDLIKEFNYDKSPTHLKKYWCYGFVIGDGCTRIIKYNTKNSIKSYWHTSVRLCGIKNEYKNRFLECGYSLSSKIINGDYIINNIDFNKKEFLEKKQYELLSKEEIQALINGLLCADGTRNYKYQERFKFITSSNSNVQDLLTKYLDMCGYFVTSSFFEEKDTNYGNRTNPLQYFQFTLNLPQKCKYKNSSEIYYKPPKPLKVISKEIDNVEDVWCLTVEDNHSFILKGGVITGNCELANLEDCLQNGTVINGKLIRKPHTLRTACTIASQIITAVSSSTYGGQTITLTHLAPFVRESRKYFANKLNGHEELIESFLKDEIKNSIQTLLYQLNTMHTTNGQSPFITLFLYPQENMEYMEETLLLCEEVLRQRIEGMESPQGYRINPTFPKLVVCLTEDMFTEKRMMEYAKLCAECVVKRMVPDFISEKNIKAIKEGCCVPPMGCRSFLHPWKDKDGNYQIYGRGNIGVISINLPYIALQSTTVSEFYTKLNEMIDIVSKEQKRVYDVICSGSVDKAPILYKYGVFARQQEGNIGEVIGNMKFSASIGYMGLAECVERFGIHYNSEEGHDFGLNIMRQMYDRANYNKEKYGIALSLYGTPAENTVTKFAKALKDFPYMANVNDRDYITNSYHIQVHENLDAFNKMDFESEFQKFSTGGAISYIECPDVKNNPEAIIELMKHIYDKMVYCEINTTSCSCCYKCGYEGELIYKEDGTFECPNCGNTDSNMLYAIYRTCGYLGSFQNGTSKGRQADIQNRVKHLTYEVSEDN